MQDLEARLTTAPVEQHIQGQEDLVTRGQEVQSIQVLAGLLMMVLADQDTLVPEALHTMVLVALPMMDQEALVIQAQEAPVI